MRNKPILWALAVVTMANAGCMGSCRNWLHRGSPCGTTLAAPAMMAAPVAMAAPVQAPQVAPVMAPVMAPAPMQQMVMPQQLPCCPQQQLPCCPQQQVPYWPQQQLPCCPQTIPCCPQMIDPCQGGYMSGSYMEGGMVGECGPVTSFDEGYLVPGSETPVDSDANKADPGPAEEN